MTSSCIGLSSFCMHIQAQIDWYHGEAQRNGFAQFVCVWCVMYDMKMMFPKYYYYRTFTSCMRIDCTFSRWIVSCIWMRYFFFLIPDRLALAHTWVFFLLFFLFFFLQLNTFRGTSETQTSALSLRWQYRLWHGNREMVSQPSTTTPIVRSVYECRSSSKRARLKEKISKKKKKIIKYFFSFEWHCVRISEIRFIFNFFFFFRFGWKKKLLI